MNTTLTAAALLKTWLSSTKRTQRHFAIEMGCTEGTLRNWLHGKQPAGHYHPTLSALTGIPVTAWLGVAADDVCSD